MNTEKIGLNSLTDEQKMDAIYSVATLLEKGVRSTVSIQEHLTQYFPLGSVHRNTAIKYRNAALRMIERDSKPMNRENIRNLEIGRYTFLIERLYKVITDYEAATPTDKRDVKWHDTYTKLWGKLNDFGARLHAITGLNEITINNGSDQRRIIFVRPNQKVEEGQVIDGEARSLAPTTTASDIVQA